MDRDTYERQAESFLAELELENYQVGAGLKPALEISPIYERYAALFEEGAVQARLQDADSGGAGRYLADLAVSGSLEDQVKGLTEEIENAELAMALPWDGREVSLQEVPVLLMNEEDRSRRRELAGRYHAARAELNPRRVRRWNRLHDLARDLGFGDYVEVFDRLRGLDLRRLAEQTTWLLDVTERPFEAELSRRLTAAGVPRTEADIWDVEAIRRSKELDGCFAAERLLPALKQTLAGLGIDLDGQANVHLDAEPRPKKSPRAFCSLIHVPGDVRLVVKPAGGLEDYGSLFHEAGHAEHYAHIDGELELPYRRLGDASVTEGYAFLFEHLLLSPAWLEGVLGLRGGEVEDSVRASRFSLAWFVRRYSAKLSYELELHAGLADGKASAYVYWLSRGCRVQIPAQRYLEDVDDGFYVAQYLRAWILEAQVRQHLETTFGPEWFAQRAAGDWLKELWRDGQKYPAEEISRRAGAAGLDVGPLVREVAAVVAQ